MNHVLLNKKRTYGFESKSMFLDYIREKKAILIALNAEKLNKTDKQLEEIINNNIGYPDGIGAVWALNKKGVKSIKIPGAEFWLDIIERYRKEKSFYFIGASQEVIDNTVCKLREDYLNIQIKGFRNGYLKDEDKYILVDKFKNLKPDIIFVAQGSPRQEILMSYFIKEYPALYMGLGGSFDLYTGKTKEVPVIWKKIFKWEGLYRSFNDIRNIKRWKRQSVVFSFLYKLWTNKI